MTLKETRWFDLVMVWFDNKASILDEIPNEAMNLEKMLERIIYNRLLPFVALEGGPSERQYGFWPAHSTSVR